MNLSARLSKNTQVILRETKYITNWFLPSNVLGNWFLNSFDNAIVDGWNPVYFGRYVDDILIVDKVEHNGIIHKKFKMAVYRQKK